MSNPWVVVALTVGLIAASAFFVAVEFALIAVRRHRLEDAAATSPSARAALRSTNELSVVLAGSQLGITACTLALGATTKPAVHYWLTPLIHAWGAPMWVADVAGFLLALAIVTVLHLVIGEMAPKSWAIADPERSLTLVAIPMRAFMAFTRPVLTMLNEAANWCLRRVGVTPVNEVVTGHSPATLRQLIEHSARVGTLDERYVRNLSRALELNALTVGDVAPATRPNTVSTDAGPADIQRQAKLSGHLRLLVTDGSGIVGVVHARDSLAAPQGATAAELMRPMLTFAPRTPVYQALHTMRRTRNHVAVIERKGTTTGLITLTDMVERLLPLAGSAA